MECCSATERYYMAGNKIEARVKERNIWYGKTKREQEFYLKYGIWGTKSQVEEFFKWKKGQHALYSPPTTEDEMESLEDEIIKELEKIEKDEVEVDEI